VGTRGIGKDAPMGSIQVDRSPQKHGFRICVPAENRGVAGSRGIVRLRTGPNTYCRVSLTKVVRVATIRRL
jgi:hypothetical protein